MALEASASRVPHVSYASWMSRSMPPPSRTKGRSTASGRNLRLPAGSPGRQAPDAGNVEGCDLGTPPGRPSSAPVVTSPPGHLVVPYETTSCREAAGTLAVRARLPDPCGPLEMSDVVNDRCCRAVKRVVGAPGAAWAVTSSAGALWSLIRAAPDSSTAECAARGSVVAQS